jgi:pimeloyl-ACP methyl ester carboxylesterase
MTKDVYDLINARVCEEIVLLGHSMGGKVAMNFAFLYPEKVQKVIVVDIAPKSYLDTVKYSSQIKMHETIINTIQKTDLKKYLSREEIDNEFVRSIDSEKIRKLLHKNIKRDKDNFSWKLNIGSLASNFNRILDNIKPAMNKHAAVPALFLRGEYSDYISDQDITVISQIFPDNKIETISGAGHWIHVEQPAILIEKIKEFLGFRSE